MFRSHDILKLILLPLNAVGIVLNFGGVRHKTDQNFCKNQTQILGQRSRLTKILNEPKENLREGIHGRYGPYRRYLF